MKSLIKCPDDIIDLFKTDPEAGRAKVVEWLKNQNIAKGDRVIMPDAYGNLFSYDVGDRPN